LESGKKDLLQIQSVLQKLTEDWQRFEEKAPAGNNNHRPFSLEINGIRSNFFYDAIANEIAQLKESMNTEGQYVCVGKYHDFDVCVRTNTILTGTAEKSLVNKFYVKGNHYYTYNNGNIGSTPSTILSYFSNALEKIPKLIEEHNVKISKKQESIQTCERVIHSTWDKEKQLNELKSELRILETKITTMMMGVPAGVTDESKASNAARVMNLQNF
jgi:hypothetical protein